MVLSLLLAFTAADTYAAPIVRSVSDEISTGLGGNWARAWPADDGGWDFLWAAGGDYVLLPMTADLAVTDFDRVRLTGRSNLVDHAITRCPDGSWLHGASANLDDFNDSAYAFRYDADFALTAEATVEERVTTVQHNDLAALCSGPRSGLAFAAQDGAVFFPVATDGAVGAPVSLPDAPRLTGGAMYYEAESDTIIAINFEFRGPLTLVRYTPDFELVERRDIDAVEAPHTGYWAQGLLRVGDVYIVAHMARDESQGWQSDEGDVWLTFFDTAWNVLERHQISHNTAPLGGMRPGLARRDDQLLVFYDKEVQPRVFDVRLDLAAMGVDGTEDSGGTWDSGTDTGVPYGDMIADKGACGCASGGGAVPAWAILGVALARRRRSVAS